MVLNISIQVTRAFRGRLRGYGRVRHMTSRWGRYFSDFSRLCKDAEEKEYHVVSHCPCLQLRMQRWFGSRFVKEVVDLKELENLIVFIN